MFLWSSGLLAVLLSLLLFLGPFGLDPPEVDWGDLITQVIRVIVAVVLPPLALFVAKWLKQQTDRLVQSIDAQWRQSVLQAVRLAVAAAEQSGLAKLIENEGKAKKEYAVKFAHDWLVEHAKIDIDLGLLADLIEAEVYNAFRAVNVPGVLLEGGPGV